MAKDVFQIRIAEIHEANSLSELASRSKSYWPYDEEYLQQCRSVTHVTADDIQKWPFIVAIKQGNLCGFSAVCEIEGEKMLDHLWVDPPYIGSGLGRTLFGEAVNRAKKLGWSSFTIASDPYAEPFYKKMGAKRIGKRESKIKRGFFLPLLEFRFSE
jgi:N-acetylglutamate synthase-like GNAT family acetyltransferase